MPEAAREPGTFRGMATLDAVRDFYARIVVASAGASDPRLIAAFASVPRERFVGPGPWWIRAGDCYVQTPGDDPFFVYQDLLVALDRSRGVNNGQPSLHARCLAACLPRPGETVVHVGSGSGYYTAILCELVGAGGRVVAYEVDAALAPQASANLARYGCAELVARSGTDAVPAADVIYVNAGVTAPQTAWLDALRVGGRLLLPLTTTNRYGWMLLVTRIGDDRYAARAVCRVGIIPCTGGRDDAGSARLAAALAANTISDVKSLYRNSSPDASRWLAGDGWWLSTTQLAD